METSQKIHLFTQEVLQFSSKNHLNTNALKEYFTTIHTATKTYSETLMNASKHFNGAIDKEYEDQRITNCYQELNQIFSSYTTQQQEIAANLEKKIIETLDSFEKTFCEAHAFIKEQIDIITKTPEDGSLQKLQDANKNNQKQFFPQSFEYKIQDSQGKLKALSQQYKDLIASDEQNQYKAVLETVFQVFTRGQMTKVKLIKDNLLYNIKTSKYCCNSASEQSTDLDEWDIDDDEPRSRRTTLIFKNHHRPACSSLLKKSQQQSPLLQMKVSTTKSNGVIPSNELGTSFAGLLCLANKDKSPEETRRTEIDQLVHYLTQEKKIQRLNISRQGSNNSSSGTEVPAIMKDQSKLRSLLFCNSDKEYFLAQFTENALPGKDSISCAHVWAGLKVIAHSLASGWKRIKIEGGERSDEYLFSLTNFLLKFFTKKKNNQRRYLGALLRNKAIWQDKDHWETIANQLLQRKTNETNKIGARGSYYSTIIETNEEDQQGQSPRGSLTSSQKKMKSEEENALKLTVIDEVNVNLLHFELDQLLAVDILLYVAQGLRLENSSYKTLEGISEKTRASELSKRLNSQAYYHDQKAKELGHLYALRLSLQFLDDQDLINVIQVNKSWRESLKKSAYKIILQSMQLTPEHTNKRMKLWKVLLEVDKMNIEYIELTLQQEGLPAKDFETSKRVIDLDVRRSYSSNGQVPKETMKRLLHKYLYSDGGKDYYQGMHQLVGFLYYLLRDEEMTLKMFMALMKKHSAYVMENEFKNLKTLLYQFDKLVYFILPDLWAHLIKEKVTVFLFVLPWIITVFTSSNHAWATPHILKVWDILLLEGWRGFFKVGIHILKSYKDKIIKSNFDEIMMFLNDTILVDFFDPVATPADGLEQAFQNVNIPKALFKQLEQEYENTPKE